MGLLGLYATRITIYQINDKSKTALFRNRVRTFISHNAFGDILDSCHIIDIIVCASVYVVRNGVKWIIKCTFDM